MQIQIESTQQVLSLKNNKIETFPSLSDDFFIKCEDLYQIQQPFALQNIEKQVQDRDIESQFELIRALTQTKKHKMRFRVNNAIQNKKNRYPQQSIYDFSRVILSNKTSNLTKNSDGYINANYIMSIQKNEGQSNQRQNKLILTQGPVDSTIDQMIQMIQSENIECVVMLCRLVENGKNRCDDYLSSKFRGILEHKKQIIKKIADDTIQISKITVLNSKNGSLYDFTHVGYSEWPDKSVPSDIKHIRDLIEQILPFNKICIHCSAGLGRSGVIAGILLVLKNKEWIQKKQLSVFRQVRKMRQYRFGAVQNSQQYGFIYKYFKNLYKKSKSSRVTDQ